MALVMIVVEVFVAFLAPAAELAGPLFVAFAELSFWLVLVVLELFFAAFYRRKVKIPVRPRFSGAREGLKSFAIKAREKRAAKKRNS